MKLSTREDIEAPIDAVFAAVADFDALERRMLRRGIDIVRDDTIPLDREGARWKAKVDWKGRVHDVDAVLVSLQPGEGYRIASSTNGVECLGAVELVALSRTRTRMFVSVDVKPTTLSARLFVQSLRLAKGTLSRKFKTRVAEFASGLNG